MTTWIWPVGSIGLQQLWPEIVFEEERKKREREKGMRGKGRKSARENVELTTLYSLTPVMAVKRLARLFLPRTRSPFSTPCPPSSFQKIAELPLSRRFSLFFFSASFFSPLFLCLSPLTREL